MIYQEKLNEVEAVLFDGTFESADEIKKFTRGSITLDMPKFGTRTLKVIPEDGLPSRQGELVLNMNEFIFLDAFGVYRVVDEQTFFSKWEPKEDSDA
jgi:hypothetical protein